MLVRSVRDWRLANAQPQVGGWLLRLTLASLVCLSGCERGGGPTVGPTTMIGTSEIATDCSGVVTDGVSEMDGLRASAQLDRTTIHTGETATLRYRLENLRSTEVSLAFYTACPLFSHITDCGTKKPVASGEWYCGWSPSHLVLPANGVFEKQVALQTDVILPTGLYSAWATLYASADGHDGLRSDPVTFSVVK